VHQPVGGQPAFSGAGVLKGVPQGVPEALVVVAFDGDIQRAELHAADKAGIAAFENLPGLHQ